MAGFRFFQYVKHCGRRNAVHHAKFYGLVTDQVHSTSRALPALHCMQPVIPCPVFAIEFLGSPWSSGTKMPPPARGHSISLRILLIVPWVTCSASTDVPHCFSFVAEPQNVGAFDHAGIRFSLAGQFFELLFFFCAESYFMFDGSSNT